MSSFKPSPSFHEAASYLSNAPALSKLSNSAKLELYGLFKFLTISPQPQSSRPSLFAIEGRAKWDAWQTAGTTWSGKEVEAEERYLEIAKNLGWSMDVPPEEPQVLNEPSVEELLERDDDNEVNRSSESSGNAMGNSVSAMERPCAAEDAEDEHGTIHGFAIADDSKGLTLFLNQHPEVNLNQLDQYGYTPLHLACDRGNIEVVKLLLDRGADSSVMDTDGYSASDLAQEAGHADIIALLMS